MKHMPVVTKVPVPKILHSIINMFKNLPTLLVDNQHKKRTTIFKQKVIHFSKIKLLLPSRPGIAIVMRKQQITSNFICF